MNSLEKEMKEYPGQSDDQTDAYQEVYNSIFNRRMFLTRLVYRVPAFILEILIIITLTIGLPFGSAWVLLSAMTVVIDPAYHIAVRALAYWLIGAVTIGGVGVFAVVIWALWSGLWKSSKNLRRLIRTKK